jgi:hypothetical protein
LEDLEWRTFIDELQAELKKEGFDAYMDAPSPKQGINISNVRLSDEYIKKHGYNVSPYTGKRGRVLGWKNWVSFNNTLNHVMNRHKISANARSLGGKFVIREGGVAYTEDDWSHLAQENVGSIMRPITREEAWVSEGTIGSEKELKEMRKRLRE